MRRGAQTRSGQRERGSGIALWFQMGRSEDGCGDNCGSVGQRRRGSFKVTDRHSACDPG